MGRSAGIFGAKLRAHREAAAHTLGTAVSDTSGVDGTALGSHKCRAYALVEMGDHRAIDVFVRREDAFAALEDAVEDEPDCVGILYVVPIELDEREVSPN